MAFFPNLLSGGKSKFAQLIKEFERLDAEANKRSRELLAPAAGLEQRCNDARKAFAERPTVEGCEELLSLLAKRGCVNEVIQLFASSENERRTRELGKLAPLFDDAAGEIEATLTKRRAEIVNEDEKRTAELGEPCVSSNLLLAIDHRLAALSRARFEVSRGNFNEARGSLTMAAG